LSVGLFTSNQYGGLIAWTGAAAPAVMVSALTSAALRAFDRVYLVNATQFVLDAWRGICMVLAASSSEPVLLAGQAFFAGAVARALLDVGLLVRQVGWAWLRPRWSWNDLVDDLRAGAATSGSLAIFAAFYSIDRIYTSRTFSLDGVASYSLAADLHTKAYFLLWAFNAALYQPLLASHHRQSQTRPLVWANVGGALAIGFFYYLPLTVFAQPIISLWIDGPTARSAAPIVVAMLPGSIAYLLASSLENSHLRTRGVVLAPMAVHAAMLLALMIGLAWLPARLGLAGVGWAHSLGGGVFLIGIAMLVWKGREQ